MKFAIFQVGDSAIATNAFARKLGIEVVHIPHPNKEMISKGVLYSPEFTCFPFKVSLGQMLYALEHGAEVFIIPKPGSVQACQLSDFGVAQKYILAKTGKKFEVILFDTLNPKELLAKFKKYNPHLTSKKIFEGLFLIVQKMALIDEVERYYRQIYITSKKKKAQAFKEKWFKIIERTDLMIELLMLPSRITMDFKKHPKIDMKNVLKIAVIGDIYTINEDGINNNIFERLCDLGVYCEKGIGINSFAQIKTNLAPEDIMLTKQAKKYLRHNVSAFAQDTIKSAIKFAEKDFDGLIDIYPFSCMPEITVRNILPKVASDYDIPILYLPMDEQTGDAGFTTRIEAFVDLIKIRKNKNNYAAAWTENNNIEKQ